MKINTVHRYRKKSLGLLELIAIALGGMVGGGIFTILGISVAMIGNLTPLAILIGGLIASLAAYSYVKLGVYYKDEGATYSFYKFTYPDSKFAASAIGWLVIFGYISTLALYAYTFSAYVISVTEYAENIWVRKGLAILVITIFTVINITSVKGMGKIEDLMVYSKLIILTFISVILIQNGQTDIGTFLDLVSKDIEQSSVISVLIVASITFVAYEGFQLVINAVNEMEQPEKNIPRAIYSAIILAILIYVIIAMGALFAIPIENIVENQEFALAAGAGEVLGNLGTNLVILGAVLATSSAISGTLFGASRQMAVVAKDGYFPRILSVRKQTIPINAIISMAIISSILILLGGLKLILEFGSITFLLVSVLMAIANFKIRDKTESSTTLTLLSIIGLSMGGIMILYYEFKTNPDQMLYIIALYFLLSFLAWVFSKLKPTSKMA